MVIAVFIKQLSVGGAEKQSLMLTRELSKQYPVFLLVWDKSVVAPAFQEFIKEHNLNVTFLNGNFGVKLFQLWRFFRKNKVSCLFNFLLVNNLAGGIAGKLAGVPLVFGGIRNCEIAPSKLKWQKLLHNHISYKTIFNNYSGTQILAKQGFRVDKMVVIHNAIDTNEEMPVRNESDVPIVFTAARFLPQKDYCTALLSIQLLKKRGVKFRYVIAGYGAQEADIRKWIEDLELNDCVEIMTDPSNIGELFQRADIYLSTSLKEGLSNSIMEAMASGLPILATNVGDNNHLVEDGKNGFLVSKKSPEVIAEILEKLIENYPLRQKMGDYGFRLVKEKFSTQHFFYRYRELLDERIIG
ncbi:glycosyltransferase [Thermophagus sp. OGC60D27]|uniref:glycosyltransferase n=1 Tax=Thermophagus sp. OGC60D27 TaxID=3458415 RepID=UPI004037816B